MATVTRENIGLLNDKLTVKVEKEDYYPEFEKALKHYAKAANIPGFRKGMVPAGVIKKMHGPAVFSEEVLKSVEKKLANYMQEEKLDIFAQPLMVDTDAPKIDMNNPAEYSFDFEIGLKPSFEINALKKSKPTRYKIEVTDEMIQNEVDRLVMRHGKMTEPETVATEENVLNVIFEECSEEGVAKEGTASKENSLLVKYFAEKFRPTLMGKKKDDFIVLQLGNVFEEKEKEWLINELGLKEIANAEELWFKMTITKVGLVEKRELNEEFFKEIYPLKEIKTEEEFRSELKGEIEKYWVSQSRNHLHHELYHVLLEKTDIDTPDKFLKRWLQTSGENAKSEEQVEEEFPEFLNQLRWTLITDKIVKENNLEVNAEELREYMKMQVMSYFGSANMDNNLEWLDSYVDRMMKDEQQVDSTYRRLVTDKVFNWAETQITPNEKNISSEDFLKLQQEHEHHHH